MYNEFTQKQKNREVYARNSLYNEIHIFGRLFIKFMELFPQATKPTKKLLALFLIGQLYTEHFTSVRNLHNSFFIEHM